MAFLMQGCGPTGYTPPPPLAEKGNERLEEISVPPNANVGTYHSGGRPRTRVSGTARPGEPLDTSHH